MAGADALSATLDRLNNQLGQIEKVTDRFGGNANRATITINAGGVGVWIATTACCVMFAVNVLLAVLYVNQQGKVEKMQDYLNAIYMQAPHLKPKEQ